MKNNPAAVTNSFTLYKRLYQYLRGYMKIFAISIVSMVVAAVTEPAFVALMKPLVDQGFVEKNLEAMNWIPLILVGLFILRGITSFINDYTSSYLAGHLVQRLRGELFSKLLTLPVSYHDNHASGRVVSRIAYDVNQVSEAGFNVITVSVKDGVTVMGLLGLLLYTDWQLTLITLIVLPVVTVCVKFVGKRLRGLSRQNQRNMGVLTQTLTESIDCARVVKIYAGQAYEEKRFARAAAALRHNQVKQSAASSLNTGITQLVIAIALAAILYFAASRARQHEFTAGDFMSFLAGMMMLFAPVKRMTNIAQSLQRGLAAAESVFGFLDERSEEDAGTVELIDPKGNIQFQQVSFRYHGTECDALKNINLQVLAGTTVALVGSSGSGKTTLASLISRLYLPTSGSISLDGTPINHFTLKSLRHSMALVSQDVVLFNDTVAANIAYGKQGTVSKEEIVAAAKAANALEFIETMSSGFDTQIGENGIKLSGGQRQRLAIARALLKNAPILILDEATSALDTQSERLVQLALDHLMQNRTTIVIAHRLSTIESANTIVVMHQGQIVEQGTHQELITKNNFYATLHQMQFKEAVTTK